MEDFLVLSTAQPPSPSPLQPVPTRPHPRISPINHFFIITWSWCFVCFFFWGGHLEPCHHVHCPDLVHVDLKGTGAGHLLGSAQHIHVPKSSPGESRWPRAPMLPVVAESPFALGIRRLKHGHGDGAAMRRGEVSGNICTASPCPWCCRRSPVGAGDSSWLGFGTVSGGVCALASWGCRPGAARPWDAGG